MKRVSGIALLAIAACGCGGPEKRGPAVGESTANDLRGPTPAASTAPVHRSMAIPTDYKTTMQHLGSGRFFSRGHASGRFDAELYATDSARASMTVANGEFQVGARFVEAHFEKSSTATSAPSPADQAPGPLFMMEKMPKGLRHGSRRLEIRRALVGRRVGGAGENRFMCGVSRRCRPRSRFPGGIRVFAIDSDENQRNDDRSGHEHRE